MNEFHTLVFDPGGKTGWTYVQYQSGDGPFGRCVFSMGTMREPEHHADVRNAIEYYATKTDRGPFNVISESFTFRRNRILLKVVRDLNSSLGNTSV